jgi:hypothetical protein
MRQRKPMRRGRRKMRGASIMGWLKSANKFLKKHKVLSTAGNFLSKTGIPYASRIGTAGRIAGQLGYGTTPTGGRYRRKGGALRLAGRGHRRMRMR